MLWLFGWLLLLSITILNHLNWTRVPNHILVWLGGFLVGIGILVHGRSMLKTEARFTREYQEQGRWAPMQVLRVIILVVWVSIALTDYPIDIKAKWIFVVSYPLFLTGFILTGSTTVRHWAELAGRDTRLSRTMLWALMIVTLAVIGLVAFGVLLGLLGLTS